MQQREKPGICRCVIQHDITEHSGCCFYVRASGECAFVWKCVTHTKELRAAWPSWCCCHADMEPSESPGELKPCREEISALLRENSVKTKAATYSENSLTFLLQHRVPLRKEQEPTACSTNSRGRGGCFSVWGESKTRLTSRVVGGGHAWVDQALWGQAGGGNRHYWSGQWLGGLGAAYPLGVLQNTKKQYRKRISPKYSTLKTPHSNIKWRKYFLIM